MIQSMVLGAKIGSICILHTWTQQMTYHPHVHCIVPAGGLTKEGKWKHAKSKGNFLFPVKAMSRLFRGKLLAGLHDLYKADELKLTSEMGMKYKKVKNKLYKMEWVVYAKKAFGGPDQVLEYLGRYTHKICISNFRILQITQTHVTFKYLDRKAKCQQIKSVKGTDFVRLFAVHILPKRFVKIRHIGFLSSRSKKHDLAKARKSLKVSPPSPKQKLTTREFIKMTTGKDPHECPRCGKGEMVIIEKLPAIRGSPVQPPFRIFARNRKVALI